MKQKIAIVTGTRAEYGLLKPLIKKFHQSNSHELQLLVTAMHLSSEFGYTVNEIINDGYEVTKKVECLLSSDSSVGVSKSISLAVAGFADAFDDLKPDFLIVLGDRTEILAAVIAATMANIKIGHIHGGETTEGAYDEGIRHSITKFSHLHFTSAEPYKKRVIQLGENPTNVFNVGAVGLDSIKQLNLLNKSDFEDSINFSLNKKNILVTYHPVTLEKESPVETFNNLLSAINSIPDACLIFTYANSDKNGKIINNMIEEYVSKNKNKAVSFKSLGQLRYLSALQHIDFVVGNSSSGIIEVPYFKIPTINIGDRQKGRLSPQSVIHTDNTKQSIENAINLALSNSFLEKIKKQESLFGDGTTSDKIFKIIEEGKGIEIKKVFYDIEF